MNTRRRPLWLGVSLSLLAALLAAGAWLGSRQHAPEVLPGAPEVAYEDFPALPEPVPSPPPPSPAKPPAPLPAGIGLVIDDVGYDLPALARLLALDVPMAIAVLPDAPHARRAAEMAHRAGRVVMLHLPMEPANPKYRARMDGSFLKSTMDRAEIRARIEAGLSRVPHVQGVNNHMGSLLTASARHMDWVMEAMREHGLFFVDSRTGHDSVAAREAKRHGLRWASRRIFLDHRQEAAAMRKAWAAAERCARAGHACIVIAHPHPATVAFLEEVLAERGSGLVRPVPELLHPAPRLAMEVGGR
ncbi:MAG: divergent polysaccharide deacetylase family protein [Mariprofundaceae bacterium]